MTNATSAYALMAWMREFELACRDGVGTGEIHGEVHLALGLEAIAAGMKPSLRVSDGVASTHRSHLHALAKGVSAEALMLEIFEKAGGLCHGRGGHMHLFDAANRFSTTGVIGASLPVALGYAYASKLAGTDDVAVGVVGDGGTNQGTFHECLNMAGAWKLPLVVLIENNGFAISVELENVIPAGIRLSDRGRAYGAWTAHVDGTDVRAVQTGFAAACAHARSGGGPAVLEAEAYRFAGHYEGDLDQYRTRLYKERMQAGDPLLKEREALLRDGQATEADLDHVDARVHGEVSEMVERVRAQRQPDPSAVFKYAMGS